MQGNINTCTTPLPAGGEDIITADPWMGEDPVALAYRLPKDSPAIDAGTVLPWMASALDLAGRPRISISGAVDMGAYERHPPGSVILVH